MHPVLTWLAIALAALFAVALAVAAWEHYVALAGRLQAWPEMPASDHVPLAPPQLKVDVNVDEFGSKGPAGTDGADRRAALAGVLDKLAQTAPTHPSVSWAETQPMEPSALPLRG